MIEFGGDVEGDGEEWEWQGGDDGGEEEGEDEEIHCGDFDCVWVVQDEGGL